MQTRPITSLFPLPDGMPAAPLRVLAAFAAVQGIVEPLTPLGQDTLKLVLTGAGRGLWVVTDLEHQKTVYSAAERLYVDVSPLLRNPLGRKIFPELITAIDRGCPRPSSHWSTIRGWRRKAAAESPDRAPDCAFCRRYTPPYSAHLARSGRGAVAR